MLNDLFCHCKKEILQNDADTGATSDPVLWPQIFASADTSSNLMYSLDVGSLIQLSSSNPNNPPRYGIIRWMGTPSGIEGIIAGVELVIMLHTYPKGHDIHMFY